MRRPAALAAALTGIAMVILGVGVYAYFSSLDIEDYAMTCTSGLGCVSRDPVVFTLHGAALQHVQPLLTAGAAIASAAVAILALRPLARGSIETRRPLMRPTIALWVLALVLLGGGSAYGIWSNTPDVVNSTIRECAPGTGCTQTVAYTFQQFAAVAVPAALTAGLLALGMAIVVTALRIRSAAVAGPDDGGSADSAVDTAPDRVWGGDDLTPFMPPSDPAPDRRR